MTAAPWRAVRQFLLPGLLWLSRLSLLLRLLRLFLLFCVLRYVRYSGFSLFPVFSRNSSRVVLFAHGSKTVEIISTRKGKSDSELFLPTELNKLLIVNWLQLLKKHAH